MSTRTGLILIAQTRRLHWWSGCFFIVYGSVWAFNASNDCLCAFSYNETYIFNFGQDDTLLETQHLVATLMQMAAARLSILSRLASCRCVLPTCQSRTLALLTVRSLRITSIPYFTQEQEQLSSQAVTVGFPARFSVGEEQRRSRKRNYHSDTMVLKRLCILY